MTGDVVSSEWPDAPAWRALFEVARRAEAPGDFLAERPMNRVPGGRALFGWDNWSVRG